MLSLRRFTPADLDDLAALHGDPEVMRLIDDGRPVSRAVVERETLPAILRAYDTLPAGFGQFAAHTGGEFVGWFSLGPAVSVGLEDGIELGYRLRRAVWGRGLATDGVRRLVRRAFTELDVELLVATTMTVNSGSRRVLEKAGLRHVRTFFADWPDPIPGAEHGDVVYALTKSEWTNWSTCPP
jgi:RimJ/RimL family protein N-acetyltransferase